MGNYWWWFVMLTFGGTMCCFMFAKLRSTVLVDGCGMITCGIIRILAQCRKG